MNKKILAFSLLTTFVMASGVAPVNALIEFNKDKKQQQTQTTILDDINFDWWKNINDEHLEKYIVSALNNNHDIKIAQLRVEQAKINIMATRAGQLPSLSVGASPVLMKLPDTTKTSGTFAVPIMANYELDIFGKNWDKTKSAKKMLEGVEYQTQASNISIISMVGTLYYNIVKLDKIIELQEKIVKDREEIFNLKKLSNDEGIVSTSDMILAEKAFVMSQNELLDYQKARQNALNALAVLIADSPNNTGEFKRISYDELSGDFIIPDEIASEIIINRPDYKSIEKQLEASGIDIRVAKKEFLPTINILGLLAFIASSGSDMGWKSAASLLGGSANLPIFDGFRNVANLKFNKNKYAQLLEQYQKTNLIAMQEVNDSLYNYKTDFEKYKNNSKALDIQKRDFEYSKMKYDNGVISKLDLLEQKETLLYMEKLAALTMTDCLIDKISLYKATGAKI